MSYPTYPSCCKSSLSLNIVHNDLETPQASSQAGPLAYKALSHSFPPVIIQPISQDLSNVSHIPSKESYVISPAQGDQLSRFVWDFLGHVTFYTKSGIFLCKPGWLESLPRPHCFPLLCYFVRQSTKPCGNTNSHYFRAYNSFSMVRVTLLLGRDPVDSHFIQNVVLYSC